LKTELESIKSQLEALHSESLMWAMGCCGWDQQEALEVIQTTYLKIMEGKARFEGRSTLKTWLFSVIRRTAQERRRRQWVHALALDKFKSSDDILKSQPSSDEDKSSQNQQQTKIKALLSNLPARQREILELVFYHDMTVEEAAKVMNVSVGTSRTHYDRAKKELAKLLKKGGLENG
jgi:RNA polymerase sigma factor (sigma-70 family)